MPKRLTLKPDQIPCPLEDWEAKEFMRKVKDLARIHSELAWVYHTPNGGFRNKTVAENLRLMGVAPGVEDYRLDVARAGYHGWIGELKRLSGSYPSDVQKNWMQFHTEQGYWVDWHKGHQAMLEDLLRYLGLPEVWVPATARPTPPRSSAPLPQREGKE